MSADDDATIGKQLLACQAPASIDEIEKFFSGTSGEADAGLNRRLFGSFLSWMQERREILAIHLRQRRQRPEEFDLDRLLEELARTSPLSWTHRERIDALRESARERFAVAN